MASSASPCLHCTPEQQTRLGAINQELSSQFTEFNRRLLADENTAIFINNGVLVNANLEQQLCQGIATLNRKTLSGEPRGKDTPFEELKGNLTFRNGIASNPDLKVRIPGLTVNGHGDIDLRVLGTTDDGTIYASRSDRKSPSAFGTLDRQTGEFTELFRDPVSQVEGWLQSPVDDTVFGVVTQAGAPKVHMIDEEHADAQLYLSLAGAFPGQYVNFSSATRDGQKIIVSVSSDRNPGELYLFDRGTGQARFLMKNRNWMDTTRSASVRPFAFKARDGLEIHGYLTLPHGVDPKNLPMIVNPHGGPMGVRDDWGYNWETQLLASRGYAVLQVNYRGSGGRGKAFEDMAYGQWATGIMNDIADATKWAIGKGYADKDRVCIYGGSFGGYAAIMGPATHPGLFKCAFGYVGAYDPQIQFKLSDTSKRDDGLAYMRRAFGATRAEQDAMSPVLHADKVKIPVYLAAGARDARCPPENTEAMFAALEAAGNTPEGMIIQSGEGHGFYEEKAREKLYSEMLAFFGRHIGGVVVGGLLVPQHGATLQ